MNLKEDQKRYKVFVDESFDIETDTGTRKEKWRYYELRGPVNKIYPYSESHLCLYIKNIYDSMRTFKYEGWKLLQDGDGESVWMLPNKDFELAAKIARPYRKRILSDQQKKKLLEMSIANSPFRKRSPSLATRGVGINGPKSMKTSNQSNGGVQA